MEQIQVVVSQSPGTITWNFEDIRAALQTTLADYKNVVYTDDMIKTARADVADLRKLKAQVEDRRKEIRSRCLEPYEAIEEQAKELTALIDEPISEINGQIKEYEEQRRKKARKEIEAYWDTRAAALPDSIRIKARAEKYDPRWENATTTKKAWKTEIDRIVEGIESDLKAIESFGSRFEDDMLEAYKASLSLNSAINTMNQLNAQRERVIEQERKRAGEEEARRQREAEEAERAKNIKAEAAKEADRCMQAVRQAAEPEEKKPGPHYAMDDSRAVTRPVREPEPDGRDTVTVTIHGTREQINKILQYIKFAGAECREVR